MSVVFLMKCLLILSPNSVFLVVLSSHSYDDKTHGWSLLPAQCNNLRGSAMASEDKDMIPVTVGSKEAEALCDSMEGPCVVFGLAVGYQRWRTVMGRALQCKTKDDMFDLYSKRDKQT